MTINSEDVQQIVKETVHGFNTRVQQHYETLSDADLDKLDHTLRAILEPKADDSAIQRRQYNPKTDTVEES